MSDSKENVIMEFDGIIICGKRIIPESVVKYRTIKFAFMLQTPNWHEIPELEIVTGTISKLRRVSDLADTNIETRNELKKIAEKPPDVQDVQTYLTVAAKPSRYPLRKFCSVRVFVSAYAYLESLLGVGALLLYQDLTGRITLSIHTILYEVEVISSKWLLNNYVGHYSRFLQFLLWKATPER
uniref:Uncharacterized protein n=1 Tax=Rhizophagus irregularis (strain DAOM 181602 / DAOM 197198 / MUCL 43194) TaxID=747089 RepID=U9SL30_RHIID